MKTTNSTTGIAVLDSGGQYCHLIARRIRDCGVSAEVLPLDAAPADLERFAGLIISGGPRSVYEPDAPKAHAGLFKMGKPILGICYGQQLLVQALGGTVRGGRSREYGFASIDIEDMSSPLVAGLARRETAWMSHGDSVSELPPRFVSLARTADCRYAAIADPARRLFGVQFHPEVTHTPRGREILRNFVFGICQARKDWDASSIAATIREKVRDVVGGRDVYFLVSGGVDSTVAYRLCAEALRPSQLKGIYVDTGLMRKNESAELATMFRELGLPEVHVLDRCSYFVSRLDGVIDPEEKRNIIGRAFVEVHDELVRSLRTESAGWVLGQGTIYPDRIESGGSANAEVIKTHHNRVPAIAALAQAGRVVEPLEDLYKDEVRDVGRVLGLPERVLRRHPFPGPGLAIRVLGSATDCAVAADGRLSSISQAAKLRAKVFPVKSVGVQGDERSYRSIAALFGEADYDTLAAVSTDVTNQCVEVNRVIWAFEAGSGGEDLHVHRCSLTETRVAVLREADAVVREECDAWGVTDSVWQFPVVLIPVGHRSGLDAIVLRPVNSIDGMTAAFARLPLEFLRAVAGAIRQRTGLRDVYLDVTNKPPATIEWE